MGRVLFNSMRKRGRGTETAFLCACMLLICLVAGVAAGAALAPSADAAETFSWYFAEGYTGDGFQEYVCVGNPAPVPVEVSVKFLFNDSDPIRVTLEIPPLSRHTFDVNAMVGPRREVSVVVSSDRSDLAVERPVYFDYQGRLPGSHSVQGADSISREWYFAEGCTGPGFDQYVCVLNPGAAPVELTFRFQGPGSEEVRRGAVGAESRVTFKVNDFLGSRQEVSLALESTGPVVAERSVYFEYEGTGGGAYSYEGGHSVMGSTTLHREYHFAEGTTRPGFDQWLTLQNPNQGPVRVTADFQFGHGQGEPVTRHYEVEGRRRATVFVPDEVGRDRDVSVRLSAAEPFLAERPVYFGFERSGLYFEGGHCAIGCDSPREGWFFAEGYTGPGFEVWLCVQNCTGEKAVATIEYFTSRRGALEKRVVEVPARTRVTLLVNEHAGPGLEVATRVSVEGGPGIAVERPIYFDTRGGIPRAAPDVLHGLCFSPYLEENPLDGGFVTVEEVAGLLDRIAPYTRWIRTFCSEGEWDAMPGLAAEREIRVAAGCDIWTDRKRNRRQVDTLISQINRGEVDLAVVGDEVLLLGSLCEDELIGYIREVRGRGVPTTTSDAWTEWLEHPNLVAECDVITVNIFPYWEGVAVEQAVSYLDYCYRRVEEISGGKKIIVETGWPSEGQDVGSAVCSPENASRYLREFMIWASENNLEYFYFEAFDEQWKTCREGPCGAHWGLWTDQAKLKPEVGKVIRAWR